MTHSSPAPWLSFAGLLTANCCHVDAWRISPGMPPAALTHSIPNLPPRPNPYPCNGAGHHVNSSSTLALALFVTLSSLLIMALALTLILALTLTGFYLVLPPTSTLLRPQLQPCS